MSEYTYFMLVFPAMLQENLGWKPIYRQFCKSFSHSYFIHNLRSFLGRSPARVLTKGATGLESPLKALNREGAKPYKL